MGELLLVDLRGLADVILKNFLLLRVVLEV